MGDLIDYNDSKHEYNGMKSTRLLEYSIFFGDYWYCRRLNIKRGKDKRAKAKNVQSIIKALTEILL